MEFLLQPRNDDGPVFNEPWEAQAFALVLALHKANAFTWDEWAMALSAEIKAAQQAGDADLGDTYYQHWLAALESIVLKKDLSNSVEISTRIAEWRDAYLATPHGQPVELPSAPA